MLYRFDPHLLAHRGKDWVVPAAYYKEVWRPAGHIEGIVMAHGQAVATWRYARKGRSLDIQVKPFGRLPRGVKGAVEKRAQGVADFFGLTLGDVNFARVERSGSRRTLPTLMSPDPPED
jgi:hypothetical protein